MTTSNNTVYYSFNNVAGTWDRADEIWAFNRPGYAFDRRTLKPVPRIYEIIVEAPYEATDEELDSAPVFNLAEDWTKEKTYHGFVNFNLVKAAKSIGWRAHFEPPQEGESEGRWYIAHPDWVTDYHRSGGTWGYSD